MRPLRLTLTAFGPYAATETVDFDALAELGLFVVAGGNGSGKTTIFDALYFALYGSLPGRRSSYQQLRSDHAAPNIECSVVLDFAAKGAHWRVERLPRQQRPKRRGDGMVFERQRATLSRLDGARAVVELNRPIEVNERCIELVGLAGNQFERVALLPQGEFSRMLRDPTPERRKLLSALFSSQVFGDTSRALTLDATAITSADTALQVRHDEQLTTLADRVSATVGAEVPHDSNALRAALDEHRARALIPLQAQAATLHDQAAIATAEHERASTVAARIQRRDRVRSELHAHREQLVAHHHDMARLDRGRAAVPVVDLARVAARQDQTRRRCEIALGDAQARVCRSLAPLHANGHGPAPTDLDTSETARSTRTDVHAAIETVSLTARTIESHELARAAVHELEQSAKRLATKQNLTHDEHTRLVAKRADIAAAREHLLDAGDSAELTQVLEHLRAVAAQRHELQVVIAAEREAEQFVTSSRAAVTTLTGHIDEAERAQRRQPQLNMAAEQACETLADTQRRREAHARWRQTTKRLAVARREHAQAQQHHDLLFDSFIQGTSARLADTLTNDCPCPVCGSIDHPSPAQASDTSATEEDVNEARRHSDAAGRHRQQLEATLSALHERDGDLGDLSSEDLADQVRVATANAVAAERAADENQKQTAGLEHLRAQRVEHDAKHELLVNDLRSVTDHRNQLTGALGAHGTRSIEDVDNDVRLAQRNVERASIAASRMVSLELEAQQLSDQIESLDLAVLALSNERSALDSQLAARITEYEAAVAALQATHSDALTGSSLDLAAVLDALYGCVEHIEVVERALVDRASASAASERTHLMLNEKLSASMFSSIDDAQQAFIDPETIEILEASTSAYAAASDQLDGQLRELGDLPPKAPDVGAAAERERQANESAHNAHRAMVELESRLSHLSAEVDQLGRAIEARSTDEACAQRAERVAAIVSGKNQINTSLEDWVLAAHLRDVVELANVRLARSTQQRFQLCVLDEGTTRRGTWGLDLAVVDSVTGTQRPTAGLSGGELFQASLALALGLADVVMNQSAGVHIDALFIDEGFGALDENSVERAIDLLDELRGRGAMVGVITHVPALLDVLPRGITVVPSADGNGSHIEQRRLAA